MEEQEKQPNHCLRHERELRGWSQRAVAAKIGTDERAVNRWENGLHKPNRHFQTQLCELFGKSAEELGFMSKQQVIDGIIEEVGKQEEPNIVVNATSLLSMLSLHQKTEMLQNAEKEHVDIHLFTESFLQELVSKENQDSKSAERRQFLLQLLESAGITLLSPTLAAVTAKSSLSSVTIEAFILQCVSGLKACWHLMKGKELPMAEELLSSYIPSLTTLIQQNPLYHLDILLGLASQAKILQAVLAMHRLNFAAREIYCLEAIQYGRFSGDIRLHAGALMYLAYTYTYCVPLKPQKAVTLFNEGLQVLGDEPSLLRSDIYIGLADAYAQCKQEQDAFTAIAYGHEYFPDHPDLDPSFLYADYGLSEIYQWEGKMYLDLARHYPERNYFQKAYASFSSSIALQSIAERSATESIIYQADAARGADDLDNYVKLLAQGSSMALALGSKKRYSEAYDIFQRTPAHWKNERQIQQLAKDIFRQTTER